MRYTQPQSGPAQVDWSAPSLRTLNSVYNGAEGRRISLRSGSQSFVGAVNSTQTVGTKGKALTLNGTSQWEQLPSGALSDGPVTRLALVRWAGTSRSTISAGITVNGSFLWEIQTDGSIHQVKTNVVETAITAAGVVGVGETCVVATSWDGTTSKIYKNGVLVASAGYTGGFATGSTPVIGRHYDNVFFFGGDIYLHADFSGALLDAEVALLSANPFRLFKSPRRRFASSAVVGNSGTLASTQNPNTISSSGAVSVSGALASNQITNSSAISGASSIAGNLGSTQFANTSAASGTTLVSGSLNSTQQLNTSNITGVVVMGVSGTLASTQQPNTSTASGTVTVSGTLTSTQVANTSTMSGIVVVSGTLVSTQQVNTSNIAGTVSTSNVIGTLASTQVANTSVAAGVVVVSGTLGSVQAVNASAISGQVQVSGALASTQAQNTSSITGNNQVTGTLSGAQSSNISAISGTVTVAMPGTLASVQAPNTMVSTGSVSISGTLASSQNPNLSNITNITSLLFGAQNQLRVNILTGPAASATFASPVLIDLGGGFGVTSSGSLVLII